MTHPSGRLDDTVHQRVRLGILTILARANAVDFVFMRDTLGLTDGNLARHIQALEDAGYVKTQKKAHGKREKTWHSITREGSDALQRELRALRELVAGLDGWRHE